MNTTTTQATAEHPVYNRYRYGLKFRAANYWTWVAGEIAKETPTAAAITPEPYRFKSTTERLWDFIKAHPGSTQKEAIAGLKFTGAPLAFKVLERAGKLKKTADLTTNDAGRAIAFNRYHVVGDQYEQSTTKVEAVAKVEEPVAAPEPVATEVDDSSAPVTAKFTPELVWEFVKANPGASYTAIQAGVPKMTSSGLLARMVRAGKLRAVKVPAVGPNGGYINRFNYTVVGNKYVQGGLYKKPKAAKVSEAETTAGAGVVRKTLASRVWHYVKLYPGSSQIEVAKGLGAEGTVNSCSLLIRSGKMTYQMASRIQEDGRPVAFREHYVVGDVYDPVGLYSKPPMPELPPTFTRPIVEAPAPAQVIVHTLDIESLTVSEAREVYLKLKAMFE